MKRLLLFFIISLLVVSCGKSEDETDSSKYTIVFNHALAQTFDANLFLLNFSLSDREKMDRAVEIIKLVVATEEFRERIINYTYNGKKAFIDNNGRSNEEIYQMILDGAETLQPARNNTMDAEIELYYANTNVIGYTYPSSRRIWINTKYFNSYNPAGVAHNLFHEWMHKLGFVHSSSWNPDREHSVPYALGYLIGEIGQDFL